MKGIVSMSRKVLILLLAVLLFPLSGCGGGGNGAPILTPTTVVATVALTGDAATTVGAVTCEVVLPAGFALETEGPHTPTSVAAELLVTGATVEWNYLPETPGSNGLFTVAIIHPNGFAGDSALVKLTAVYPVGATLPVPGDFDVSLSEIADLDGGLLGGVGIAATSAAP